MQASLYFNAECELAEGPVWVDGRLWWVDIEAGQLRNDASKVYTAPASIGAAVPCRSGRWLLAEEEGFALWDLKEDPLRFWIRPDAAPAYRFNDAKVAPDGSVIAGSLKRGTLNGNCSYYRLDPRGDVVTEQTGLGLCNGIDWFGDRFYFTDTGAQTIYVREAGTQGVFACFETGYPDGLTVDLFGNVWVALWGEGQVLCLDAGSGKVVETIEVDAPQVSSCCFGGHDWGTLFITTARTGMTEAALAAHPQSGSIFNCRPGVTGCETRMVEDKELS